MSEYTIEHEGQRQIAVVFVLVGLPLMLDQARRQYDVVQRNRPAKLTWYFMQPVAHEYSRSGFDQPTTAHVIHAIKTAATLNA
jgi:hypothetical protein